jgi:hypothetical protein
MLDGQNFRMFADKISGGIYARQSACAIGSDPNLGD